MYKMQLGKWSRLKYVICRLAYFFACIFLFTGIFTGTVLADTAEESFKKYQAANKAKDYETAERELRKAAESGDVTAQILLGLWNVCNNDVEAAKWFRRAAEQGHSSAQLTLCDLLREGGCEEDVRDYGEAIEWCRKAAESSNMDHRASAQFLLGEMYEHGWGVSQDLLLAHMWYNLSSMRTDFEMERKQAAAARDKVARRLSPEQLVRAQKMAEEGKPR